MSSDTRVFVSASAAEPFAAAKLSKRLVPLLSATFEGGFIPGVNTSDWSSLGPGARMAGPFMSPAWRSIAAVGRFERLPLTYHGFARRVAATRYAAGLFMITPPDTSGVSSFGTTADFPPTALDRCDLRIGVINPSMPRLPGSPTVPLSVFDEVIELDTPLADYGVRLPGAIERQIIDHVVGMIPNGATLQAGIGRLGDALWPGLSGKEGLSLHSGMICDPVASLIREGVFAHIRTGSLLGSRDFYAQAADLPGVTMAPALETHDPERLGEIPALVAVNSAIEVDLLGQVNAEWVDGEAISGPGGLPDFIEGASRSPGGLPIIALGSTAKGGALSRIVPRLSVPVTLPATEVGIVVTEHGAVDLRPLQGEARAMALIEIAAPDHRTALQRAWHRGV
ncbi:acetyl-CoA hydrolase/transferase family protein [Caulobacter henricii]|nr:acetyl-CoA hydrolase/transferase C-terminal domain-containing protein [Caulobacter henricii]